MKMNKKFYALIIGLLSFAVFVPAHAQIWKKKKADEFYYRFDYIRAIPLYESIKNKDAEIYRKLGRAYYVMGNFRKAEETYEKLIASGTYTPDDIYQYAYYLRILGEYEEAGKWMQKFARLRPNDSRGQRFLADPDYYKELLVFNPKVQINNVSVNEKYDDFGPAGLKDSLVVFASSRGLAKNWTGNDQPFLDLYTSVIVADTGLSQVKPLSHKVNSKFHDGPASFNKAGDYMVLTRNIYNEKKLNENKLWLYESWYHPDKGWSKPKPLHFNSKNYSCGHPSLSADGQTLYFASDAPGGFGGLDIYVVKRLNDSTWGQPKNVGAIINTEGNEMFPTWDSEQGYLFFSSDGLPGLGGLDIFVVKIEPNGDMSDPVNIGAPINSSYDDFAIYYRPNETGFFSSNRPGGKGADDIYGFRPLHNFKKKAVVYYLTGKVLDKNTGQPIPANVIVTRKRQILGSFDLSPGNDFKVQVHPGTDYVINASAPGYLPEQVHVTIQPSQVITRKDIALMSVRSKEIVDLCQLGIEPLYYDLDKYYIRSTDTMRLNKIIRLLNKYPDIKLEIASHTDSRASDDYNIELSRKRTMSVVNYLVENGISRDRLVAKWYGETRPVNGCINDVPCTEEQHQLNRRTEFIIINCDEIQARK